MPIRLLSEAVASRIAAGEVVERPASVVKELVENSLDAGATRVEVETHEGGIALIRVRDNGGGILTDELALAFRRHATSKLETADDLEHIATLGFRGEALASIAAVSRTTCITRHASEATGTRIRLEAGEVVSQGPVGRPPGTEMVIEDLFYNVPARRKFLKTHRTERSHIDAFITRYAIAYPRTAFTVVHDGREVLTTAGTGDVRDVLLSVYGTDLGAALLEVPADLTLGQPICVGGFVGPTNVHRANRGYLTIFVNGRWIEDLRLAYAIIQAYHTLLPVKRYPVAFATVELAAEDVDINVHPAKSEVRFRDPDAVFRAVQRAVRATVLREAPATTSWSPEATADHAAAPASGLLSASRQPGAESESIRARLASLAAAQTHIRFGDPEPTSSGLGPQEPSRSTVKFGPAVAAPQADPTTAAERRLPVLRTVGQLATMYIIAEGPDGLYLIDQHAAHERVLYERLLSDALRGQIATQPLLSPEAVALPADEASRLEELLPALGALGVEVEPFGPSTFLVRALPALLTHLSPADLLADIAATAGESSPVREELEEAIIRHICKRAAVKAGQVLSREEMEHLIRDLEATGNPRTCPHGRPTIVQISTHDLARHFGRD